MSAQAEKVLPEPTYDARAVASLERACAYLFYSERQWLSGEALAARDEAIGLMRERILAMRCHQALLTR